MPIMSTWSHASILLTNSTCICITALSIVSSVIAFQSNWKLCSKVSFTDIPPAHQDLDQKCWIQKEGSLEYATQRNPIILSLTFSRKVIMAMYCLTMLFAKMKKHCAPWYLYKILVSHWEIERWAFHRIIHRNDIILWLVFSAKPIFC